MDGALAVKPRIAGGPPSAQRIGVVDAIAASQRGGDQRHHLVAGVRPAFCMRRRGRSALLSTSWERPRCRAKVDWQQQAGIGHQAVIVKGDLDAVGVVAW